MTRFFACGKDFSGEKSELGKSQIAPGYRYLINPGSVGQPRDGLNNQAKYLIWDQDEKSFEYRAIPYDVQATVDLINKRGFPEFNGIRLLW